MIYPICLHIEIKTLLLQRTPDASIGSVQQSEEEETRSTVTEQSQESSSSTSTITMISADDVAFLAERKEDMKLLIDKVKDNTVHKIRSDDRIELYKLYCEICYPAIVGKQKWKVNHKHIALRTLVTVADEALVALILENNMEEWMMLAKGETIDSKNRKTMYTFKLQESTGQKSRWS